jgi:hypothetical protein
MTVDIHHIPSYQQLIHERLENWSRWGTTSYASRIQPMFKQAKSNWRQWHEPDIKPLVDSIDAIKVEKLVNSLQQTERAVIIWYYLDKSPARRMERRFQVTKERLCEIVINARNHLLTIDSKTVEYAHSHAQCR